MTAIEFETYCAQQLSRVGWDARVTKQSQDQGVDVVAEKNGIRVVLQCKLYSRPVGNKAVQEAVAARGHEQANYGAVVSNQKFTQAAEQLASTNNILLIHHSDLPNLSEMIGVDDPMNLTISIDLSKETVGAYNESKSKEVAKPQPQPSAIRTPRRSGDYWIELNGKRLEFGSLRELLAQSLRSIEAAHPGTLEKLSHIKPKSKRIVARDKKMLFDSEHLSDDYGEQLMDGWWYGTNNSAQETNAWLERACGCAGLTWGIDFRTNL